MYYLQVIGNKHDEICSDSTDYPWGDHCSSWKIYCSSNARVKKFCMKTCNSCKNVNSQGISRLRATHIMNNHFDSFNLAEFLYPCR